MPTPEKPIPSGSLVVIGLMNGRERRGWLTHFSPLLPSLVLAGEEGSASETLPVPEIAYVGFLRAADEAPPKPLKLAASREVMVHTAAGPVFRVQVVTTMLSHPAGFYGYELGEKASHTKIFFFAHGVKSKESTEPIGKVLVTEGLIDAQQLEAALAVQVQQRNSKLGEILVEKRGIKPEGIDASLNLSQRRKMRLGEVLVETGLASQDDIQAALKEQKNRRGKRLGEVLIEMGVVTQQDLTSALALKFHMPLVNLDEYPINPAAASEVPSELIAKYTFLPVDTSAHSITIAISDPLVTDVYDLVRFHVAKKVNEVLATPGQLKQKVEVYLATAAAQSHSSSDLLKEIGGAEGTAAVDDLTLVNKVIGEGHADEDEGADQLKDEADAPPIIRLVNRIIVGALEKRASDIHALPQARGLVIAYRIDGDLREEMVLDRRIQRQVISRFKIIASMNIAEHRLPQDGRILLQHKGKDVELRVSNIPNSFGESLVMRVLNKEMAVDLQVLGMRPRDTERLVLLTRRPFGLLLVTGPTGSGKSTTLFAVLKEVIKEPLHVITIEDPVESEIAGVNQVQANPKIDLTFSRILRNILRHDPDVIMVGEMRDKETASIGIEAALTGHLMLSTLHTNTAVDTVARLTDMGIPPYLLAPALLGIVSQNLIKKLCPQCRKEDKPSDVLLRLLDKARLTLSGPLFVPGKCSACADSGFKGRTLIYEFMEVDDPVRDGIHSGLTGGALERIAMNGGLLPKSRHALELATQGIISMDDLISNLV